MPSKPLAKLLPRPAVRPGAAATALVAFVEVTGMEYQDALPNLLADLIAQRRQRVATIDTEPLRLVHNG